MSHKTTPEKNDKKRMMGPRRLNLEEEPRATNGQESRILKGKKKNYRHRDANSIAIVHPTMIHPPSICQSYPPVFPLGYSPAMPAGAMTSYVPPIITGYPLPDTRWNTIISTMHNPLYNVPIHAVPPMPVPIYSPMGCNSQICPYGSPVLTGHTMYVASPLAASVAPLDYSFGHGYESAFYEPPRSVPSTSANNSYTSINDEITKKLHTSPIRSKEQFKPLDPESYLLLPKELFPTARALAIDPNPLIDAFCRLLEINKHSPWILDLEFGVPRQPLTRPIATYDAQFNSIHCKNTPGAIHPGFESCSEDFKTVFLFYYDCIISAWYKGYVITNSDRSVVNFQTWLQVPMNLFGMCWP